MADRTRAFARERRSRRRDRSPSADRRHRRRHQLSGGGDRKPGRHSAYRGPSLAGRRNRRPEDRAHRGAVRALHESGLQIAGAERRALRDLDEALGQSDLQSGERAEPCDARRHLPLRADPRARRGDDAAKRKPLAKRSASVSGSASKSASPARRASARTRPRCCRTSSTAARPRSTRSWARSSNSRASSMSRPRILTPSMR